MALRCCCSLCKSSTAWQRPPLLPQQSWASQLLLIPSGHETLGSSLRSHLPRNILQPLISRTLLLPQPRSQLSSSGSGFPISEICCLPGEGLQGSRLWDLLTSPLITLPSAPMDKGHQARAMGPSLLLTVYPLHPFPEATGPSCSLAGMALWSSMPEKDVQLLFLQLHIFPQAVRQTSRAEARTGIPGEKTLCIKREAEAEA